jgi:hypothetical protein
VDFVHGQTADDPTDAVEAASPTIKSEKLDKTASPVLGVSTSGVAFDPQHNLVSRQEIP